MSLTVFLKKIFSLRMMTLSLAVISFFVYSPSLFHVARSDQDCFFIETVETDGLGAMIARTYSYSRQRTFNQGDRSMFKPLYFVILSLQKKIFGFNYFYWQLATVILHIGLVLQLYKFLKKLCAESLAYWLALFFGVNFAVQDMVTFQHMNVCLILYILILQVLCDLKSCRLNPSESTKLKWRIFTFLALSCFLREYALIYTSIIFIALFIFWKKEERPIRPWLLLLPIAIYTVWTIWDYVARIGFARDDLGAGSWIPGFFKFLMYSVIWPLAPVLARPIMPTYPTMRVVVAPRFAHGLLETFTAWTWIGVGLGILFLFVVIITIIISVRRNYYGLNNAKGNGFVVFIGLFCALGYAGLTAWGRFRGVEFHRFFYNTYYLYPILLFFITMGASLAGPISQTCQGIFLKNMLRGGIILLVFMSCENGFLTYQWNQKLAQFSRPIVADRQVIGLTKYYLAKRYNALGVFSMREGKYLEAREMFFKAMTANPLNENVFMNAGMNYLRLKEIDNAQWCLKRAWVSADSNGRKSIINFLKKIREYKNSVRDSEQK